MLAAGAPSWITEYGNAMDWQSLLARMSLVRYRVASAVTLLIHLVNLLEILRQQQRPPMRIVEQLTQAARTRVFVDASRLVLTALPVLSAVGFLGLDFALRRDIDAVEVTVWSLLLVVHRKAILFHLVWTY